jgi:hypothetical protein
MKKRVVSRRVGWAGRSLLAAGVLAAGVLACSSGGGESAPATEAPEVVDREIDPDSAPPDTREVNYQFVDTPDGMTVEAISGDQVQSLSCPTRTCAGLCDECAAAACRAVGELAAACDRLTADCSSSCTCSGVGSDGPSSCGFPVCATNRNLCYVGNDEGSTPGLPSGPAPDPAPESPTTRPSGAPEAGSSSASSGARPAG